MKKLLAVILILAALALAFTGCTTKDDKTIKVAASPTPHAELLEQCKAELEKKGYKLEIIEMSDYIIPNTSTEEGEVDANFFQHTPYLDSFNKENNTHLVSVGKVHFEPYGIYAGKVNSIDAITEGGKIAIPNDPTNAARALLLLEANGIIKLAQGKGLEAKQSDIIENPKNVEILEVEAALVPNMRSEVDVAVINGNYAIGAGLKVKDAIAVEDSKSEAAQTFANVLVVKTGNENNEGIKALVEALQSDAVKNYIENTYDGAVVPMK